MYPQSSSPSADHADPFRSSTSVPRRYVYNDVDGDSDSVDPHGRRDTYASDSSNNGLNDPERYYDHSGNYDSYGVWSLSCAAHSHTHSHLCDFSAQPDTDSDVDIYGQRYPPASSESLGPRVGLSDTTATAYAEYAGPPGAREPHPAWSAEIPLSKEEIEDIFLDLTQKFGFQRDSAKYGNLYS